MLRFGGAVASFTVEEGSLGPSVDCSVDLSFFFIDSSIELEAAAASAPSPADVPGSLATDFVCCGFVEEEEASPEIAEISGVGPSMRCFCSPSPVVKAPHPGEENAQRKKIA